MHKVSVIVPIYNSEPYIRETVDSILQQSFRDLELILVDDGSTDGSGRIIDEYAALDSRVLTIHRPNGGPAAARNAGLDAASGEYVYFVDSDDAPAPELLETVLLKMEQGWDMVVFGFSLTQPPDKKEKINMRYPIRKETELSLDTDEQKLAFLCGPFRRRAIRWEVWNRVFRRDIIEKWHIRFGYDRRVFAEDMYFVYFYLAHITKILLLPDILYTYRKHMGSESDAYKKHLMIYSSNRMTEQFFEHCRISEDCRYLYEHFLPVYYLLHKGAVRRLRRHQWKNGLDMDKAREILRSSVVDHPAFLQRMKEAYEIPVVKESYRKDRNKLLQLTDRLYTAELLELPAAVPEKVARKILLRIIRVLFDVQRTLWPGLPAGKK